MANEVFISYSRKDFTIVSEIKKILDNKLKIDCWMDLDGIESGDQFEEVITSAIKRHNIFLFMQTINSMNSEYAWKEIKFAKKKRKRIVMVRLDNEPMTDKFSFEFDHTDNIVWSDDKQQKKLISNLRDWIGIPIKPKKGFNHLVDTLGNVYVLSLGERIFEEFSKSHPAESNEELKSTFCKHLMQQAESHYLEGKYKEAFLSYFIAASFGDIDGCVKTGDCYFWGEGVEVDIDMALTKYKIAAAKGHKLAIKRVNWIKRHLKP